MIKDQFKESPSNFKKSLYYLKFLGKNKIFYSTYIKEGYRKG